MRLTLAEFERLPEDDLKHELDEGELVSAPPAPAVHGAIQARIGALLHRWCERSRGTAMIGVGAILRRASPTLLGPDISYLRPGRPFEDDAWVEGAPDLAVEIVSLSDSAAALERRVRQYLAAGAHTVWVVYPRSRSVHVFEHGSVRIVEADGNLEAPELLPGFSIPVESLFK